jgi:hypothetical protein
MPPLRLVAPPVRSAPQAVSRLCLGLSACALLALLTAPQVSAAPVSPSSPDTTAPKPPAMNLRVDEMVFARGYDRLRKAPLDTGSVFPADVGQVICFTRITGATLPTQVTHVWRLQDRTLAEVDLVVGSANWRTYSSKLILPSWTGPWTVDVLDESGTVLASKRFRIGGINEERGRP